MGCDPLDQPIVEHGSFHCCGSRADGRLGEEERESISEGLGWEVQEEAIWHDSRHLVNAQEFDKHL